MVESNGNKYVSLKWVLGILVSVLMLMAGGYFANLESRINAKVDKETYCNDIREIKQDLKTIKNWHLPTELRGKE